MRGTLLRRGTDCALHAGADGPEHSRPSLWDAGLVGFIVEQFPRGDELR